MFCSEKEFYLQCASTRTFATIFRNKFLKLSKISYIVVFNLGKCNGLIIALKRCIIIINWVLTSQLCDLLDSSLSWRQLCLHYLSSVKLYKTGIQLLLACNHSRAEFGWETQEKRAQYFDSPFGENGRWTERTKGLKGLISCSVCHWEACLQKQKVHKMKKHI